MERSVAAKLLQEKLKDIFAFSVSRLYSKQDAEDLTNEIILQVLSSVSRLNNDSAFYGYMWKIAENTFKQYIRKSNNVVEFNENFSGVYWETPESKLLEAEDVSTLRRELSLLSKQYREATVSYYIENKTIFQISNDLNLSEEMVKYYLFKARKKLKEGFNMERKLGEKSYNPSKFAIDFWGNGGSAYIWQTFERKLPGNIVIAAYDKPVSIEDLSLELGVASVYIEDELDILLKYNFINKTGNKYQTDFLIFTSQYENDFREKINTLDICKSTVDFIKKEVDTVLPEFKGKNFNISLDDNQLKWFIINFALINALDKFEAKTQEKFGEYPILNSTSRGFVYGHDNDYFYGYFAGIYGRCENSANTARYTAVNYNVIKSCQLWMVKSPERSEILCDAVLGDRPVKNQELTAQLAAENMLFVKDGKLKANFPTFAAEDFDSMENILRSVSESAVKCMDAICTKAAVIFKKYTPKELKGRCEQLCYVRHQADAMGIIIEELVSENYLKVPDKKTNLCIFGVKR